ncbi:signal peptidase I [Dehalococcoidia bacterium]|nr:signal peptidase I [Dehalococcoidia bacterium]
MRKPLREFLRTALVAIILFSVLQATVQNYRVEGSSMEPTLESDQRLFVNKLIYYRLDMSRLSKYFPFLSAESEKSIYVFRPPDRGDVIVFHFPKDQSRDFVKRVIAVPGDAVEIRRGEVYVNGEPVDEPYVMGPMRYPMGKKVLGFGQYFVLGDNRMHSNDSRDWGFVPVESIVGRALVRYWPFSSWSVF